MINFPNNPTLGDAFSQGGTVYTCVLVNPVVWNAAPGAAAIPEAPLDGLVYGRREAAWKALDKADVGLDKVDNTSDATKPVSNPTQTALNGKEPVIAIGGASQYWRGDKTWQVLNAAAAGAVAKTGDVMSGNLTVNGPASGPDSINATKNITTNGIFYQAPGGGTNSFGGGLAVTGSQSIGGQLDVATGMGFRWDGGNANYLAMGAGQGSAWNWQYIRSTGGLAWLNSASVANFSIDPSGNTNAPGEVRGGSLASNTVINAAGRITSSSNDVAALYGGTGNSGIYTECNGGSAFRSTNGGAMVNPSTGYRVAGSVDDGSNNICYMLTGNPAWNDCWLQAIHSRGYWAGWRMWSSNGNLIDYYMSNGGGWGSINAAAFNVVSDERTKLEVAPLSSQHSAFMAIQPISWKRNFDFKNGNVGIPERHSYGDVDGTIHEPPPFDPLTYDDPDKIHWGFSAQNLVGAVRNSVEGDVTAVDEKGAPISAGVNPIPILAVTVLEVQALWNKVAELEAEVAALKGQ